MKDPHVRRPIKIPVRYVDGTWEYFYGGAVPVRAGTIGDLTVDFSSITDKELLAKVTRKSQFKILPVDTELMVALSIKLEPQLPRELTQHLVRLESRELSAEYYQSIRGNNTQFISIHLCEPSQQFVAAGVPEGGIWLRTVGGEPDSLASSAIRVPREVSDEAVDSLNHAFTMLSERYEPWRKSHTGNIYTRVLYRERSGLWYPLDVARQAALATDEQSLIKEQWEKIAQQIRRPK